MDVSASFCISLLNSLRLRTLGDGFFLGFAGIFGVCFLTLPAFVSEPWLGIGYTPARLLDARYPFLTCWL